MKKIALFSLVIGLGLCSFTVYADDMSGTCAGVTVSFEGNQDPDDNEFLYQNETQFEMTKSGYANSGNKNSGYGVAFECDDYNPGGCSTDDWIELPAGHYWKGEKIPNKQKYICNTFGDDEWIKVDDKVESCKTKWGNLEIGHSYKNKTTIDCSGLTMTESNVGLVKSWEVVCRPGRLVVCKAQECIEGYEVNSETGKCVPGAQQCTFSDGSKHNLGDKVEFDCSKSPDTPEFRQNSRTGVKCYQSCLKRLSDNALTNYWSVKTCPSDKGYVDFDNTDYQKYTPQIPGYKRCADKNAKKTCEEIYKGNQAAIDCCKAGQDWKNGKCECKDETKEWDAEAKQCIAKEGNEEPEYKDCTYRFKGSVHCANGNNYVADSVLTIPASKMRENGLLCDEFERLYNDDVAVLLKFFNEYCQSSSVPPYTIDITNETKIIDDFMAGAEKEANAWKTKDGKFNSMRLASDLTAGVVLGTVGGVVSGVVIKKKQVEKGFEALHCTVGGQTIADWGDTFTVGLQR